MRNEWVGGWLSTGYMVVCRRPLTAEDEPHQNQTHAAGRTVGRLVGRSTGTYIDLHDR